MYKDIKEGWLENLRSEKFVQGRGMLINLSTPIPSFCCLGVLCATLEGYTEPPVSTDHTWMDIKKAVIGKYGLGNTNINELAYTRAGLKIAGITDELFSAAFPGKLRSKIEGLFLFATLNDSLKLNFNQIADLIEAGISETERPAPDVQAS